MSDRTAISWTDATWNPIRGCTRVSEGCKNCYAEIMTARFSDPGQWGEGLAKRVKRPDGSTDYRWTGKLTLAPGKMDQPLHWRKPRRIFVNSTSDLFHESVRDDWIDQVFAIMALCPQHTFQVLTKRPERMRDYILCGGGTCINIGIRQAIEALGHQDIGPVPKALPNVHLGTSVEDQATADQRIPQLLATPAAVRFISAEPLLGAVNLPRFVNLRHGLRGDWPIGQDTFAQIGLHFVKRNPYGARSVLAENGRWLGVKPHECDDIDIDWLIIGAESGHGARPMDPAWAQALVDQCRSAGVPVFVKQMSGPGGRAITDMDQFPEALRVREWPHD